MINEQDKQEELEQKSYFTSGVKGLALSALDAWTLLTNPAYTISAVAKFIDEMLSPGGAHHIKESIIEGGDVFMKADSYKKTEYTFRAMGGGGIASFGLKKLTNMVNLLKTPKMNVKLPPGPPVDRNLYFLDLHTNYIRKASNNELKIAALTSEDMFEAIAKAHGKKTFSHINPLGFVATPLIYGASDRPETQQSGFSFFNEAHAKEHDHVKRDEALNNFANAYGLDINKLDEPIKNKLFDILEKQRESNNLPEFSDRLNAAAGTFSATVVILEAFNFKHIQRINDIGLKTINLAHAAHNLQHAFPLIKSLTDPNGPIGKALANIGSVHPYAAFAAAAVQLAFAIFSKPAEDPFRKQVMEYLQATLDYIEFFRQEVHLRFDRLEFKSDETLRKLDVIKEAIIIAMNANLEIELKGIGHLESILEHSVNPKLRSLEAQIQEFRLDDLNTVLIEINAHRQGKINKKDMLTKLDELMTLDRNLVQHGLKRVLVSDSVNGASKVTPVNMPDPEYIFDALDNGHIPLGLLDRFARYYLNMNDKLSVVQQSQIPLLRYWPHVMNAHIGAQIYAAQHYNATLSTEHVESLTATTKNTQLLIETLAQNSPELFKQMITYYTQAVKSIHAELTKKMVRQIEACAQSYTPNEALKLGLLPISKQAPESYKAFVKQSPTSTIDNLPAVLFLSQQLGLIDFVPKDDLHKKEGEPVWLNRDDSNDKFKYIYNYFKFVYSVDLVPKTENATAFSTMLVLAAERRLPDKYTNNHKDHYAAMMNAHIGTCQNEYSLSNATLISYCTLSSFVVSPTLKRDVNRECADTLASTLIEQKLIGTDFAKTIPAVAHVAHNLFAGAVNDLIIDRASYAAHERTMKLMLGMAIAYGKAIGLDAALLKDIQNNMILDVRKLMTTPGLYQKTLDLETTLTNVTQATPDLSANPIITEMKAAEYILQHYQALSADLNIHTNDLHQWHFDLAYYQKLDTTLSQMRDLNLDVNALITMHQSMRADFDSRYATLMTQHDQLKAMGFPVSTPSNVDDAFAVVITPESYAARRGAGLPDPLKSTLFEIIETSGNPLLDTSLFLNEKDFASSVAYTNTVDPTGKTALHHAAILNDKALMELLIRFDAPISLKDHMGKTAIDYLPKHADESRTLLRSRMRLETAHKTLGYSINQAISPLREALAYHQSIEESDTPAVIFDGESGDGKSSIISNSAGTNYKEGKDAYLQKIIIQTNDVAPIAESSTLVSGTKEPHIYPLWGYHFIDVAGDHDTQGPLRDMVKDFTHNLLMKKQHVTKAHAIVISDEWIFTNRMSLLRNRFSKIGQIIKKDPARLAQHILLVISKPDLELLHGNYLGDPKSYEKRVFAKLMLLKSSLGKVPEKHPDADMLRALEHLTIDNILLYDVTDTLTRERFRKKLDSIPVTLSEDFNFSDLNNQAAPFKQIISTLIENLESINDHITSHSEMLGRHWEHHAHSDKFGQEKLIDISIALSKKLNALNETKGSLKGSVDTLTEELTELMREADQQKGLVTELGDLSMQLGLPVSENIQKMVETSKPDTSADSGTAFQVESTPWETQPGFADEINNQLYVFQYLSYYFGYLLPSNWPRVPSEGELSVLNATLAQLKTYHRPLDKLRASSLNDPNLFGDNIAVISNHIGNMTQTIQEIQTSHSVTNNQLADLQYTLSKTQSMIVELTDVNKQLTKLIGTVDSNERIVLSRQAWTNKLTVKRERIEEPTVGAIPPFVFSSPSRVFTPIWSVKHADNQVRISNTTLRLK